MNVPFSGTLEWIRSLNMTLSDVWKPWLVDGQVAGLVSKIICKTSTSFSLYSQILLIFPNKVFF
jgi:hypothetical protein